MPIPALVAMLMKSGLTLLGNAVLEKGKEEVEKRLGVKLPEGDKPLSQEQLLSLKQLEFDNEASLREFRLENRRLDSEDFKVETNEKNSARERDKAFILAGERNYRADVMFFLAVVVVCALVWIVWKDDTITEFVKGIFTLVLGRFLGYLDNIYNFEFGTTRGSKSKDATIEHLSKKDRK